MRIRILAATAAMAVALPAMTLPVLAQQPPAPPPADVPAASDMDRPAPPPGERPDGPPPRHMGMKPGGPGPHWRRGRQAAEFKIHQDEDGTDVEVKCAGNEPMKACADIMMQLLDRVGMTSDGAPAQQ